MIPSSNIFFIVCGVAVIALVMIVSGNSSNDRRPTCYGNQQNRQIEGDENGVALAADQSFPEVEP